MGPAAVLEAGFPVLCLMAQDEAQSGMETTLDRLRAIGADCYTVETGPGPVSDHRIEVADVGHPLLAPMAMLQTMYRLAENHLPAPRPRSRSPAPFGEDHPDDVNWPAFTRRALRRRPGRFLTAPAGVDDTGVARGRRSVRRRTHARSSRHLGGARRSAPRAAHLLRVAGLPEGAGRQRTHHHPASGGRLRTHQSPMPGPTPSWSTPAASSTAPSRSRSRPSARPWPRTAR